MIFAFMSGLEEMAWRLPVSRTCNTENCWSLSASRMTRGDMGCFCNVTRRT